jgi:hypothetical protein
MLTFHPTAAKAYRDGVAGYRPMIMLRNSRGTMGGSKCSSKFTTDKEEARTLARAAAHRAAQYMAQHYPAFPVHIA